MNTWKSITFRNGKTLSLPLLQGGMGVGVSRCRLAGAVALEGGAGVISTAQIGFDEEGFEQDAPAANLKAIEKHIRIAKELSQGKGLIGVNVMHALQHYKEHVTAAARAGADLIICGAGLPTDLPELVKDTDALIAPIVSSCKAAQLLVRSWMKKYQRYPDLMIVEGPKAGGHLGFKPEQLKDIPALDYDQEISTILSYMKEVSAEAGFSIPVFLAGGISTKKDVDHAFELGADGVQVATRFVPTLECDASFAYKEAYLKAKPEDVCIVKSPVGMPGRALNNAFMQKVTSSTEKVPIQKCYRCIKNCNPAQIPYCITQALINAVKGDLDNGLIFCGAEVGQVHSISTVHEVVAELF